MMRRFWQERIDLRLLTLLSLATVALSLPGFALAAGTANQVLWGSGQPKASKGQISGSGTYVAAQGWTITGITMSAVPTGGGQVQTVAGAAPAGGNWGPITITGLAPGQYTVYAIGTFKSENQTQYISSSTVIITVPSQ
jgi:hypothetical protein